jgi:hypothetical protein
VSSKLRKAQAIAASVTIELDPDAVVIPAEVLDVTPPPCQPT